MHKSSSREHYNAMCGKDGRGEHPSVTESESLIKSVSKLHLAIQCAN
jgi:hypothetical protein